MEYVEVNFDGLVGPTHHYGGHAQGNLASQWHKLKPANPRAAALQSLKKARMLAEMGHPQAILPPHPRPFWPLLRAAGFSGDVATILAVANQVPDNFLAKMMSSANMWAANAATVTPATDSPDSHIHITPANLISNSHRAIEPLFGEYLFSRIFADTSVFSRHPTLPFLPDFADEGAANVMRLWAGYGQGHDENDAPNNAGINIFVYGRDGPAPEGLKWPARQTKLACQAIARNHGLNMARTVFIQQSQKAINAGAFHNDVVAVSNGPVIFCHQEAFENKAEAYGAIGQACANLFSPIIIEVPQNEVPLEDAVASYLFNGQLLDNLKPADSGVNGTGPDGTMRLFLPQDCTKYPKVQAYLEKLLAQNGPIKSVQYVDLRQSMDNGGGPACLRLRMMMRPSDIARVKGRLFLDDRLYEDLVDWINAHYWEEVTIAELADPALAKDAASALEELAAIVRLDGLYDAFLKP